MTHPPRRPSPPRPDRPLPVDVHKRILIDRHPHVRECTRTGEGEKTRMEEGAGCTFRGGGDVRVCPSPSILHPRLPPLPRNAARFPLTTPRRRLSVRSQGTRET